MSTISAIKRFTVATPGAICDVLAGREFCGIFGGMDDRERRVERKRRKVAAQVA